MGKDNKQNQGKHIRIDGLESGEKHLISDETLMKKFGAEMDNTAENESEPPRPEKKSKEPGPKKKRTMWIVIAIVVACAIGLILWLAIPNNSRSHYDNNMSGLVGDVLEAQEGYPATINGTDVTSGNFLSMDKDLVYVSDTSLVRLNRNADVVFDRSHSYYHPIVRMGGEYLLVYNVGSTGFRIDNQKETLRSEDAENTIMAADVAENGRYALVTETKGYPSLLSVYKDDGSLQYKYSFSNCYVTDIALSDDGSKAAAIGVTANEGALVSEVYLLNLSDETPMAIVQCEGTMLMAVEYTSDGRALAVGDDRVISVNESGEMTAYEYGNRKLAGYDFNESRVLVALSPYDTASASLLAVVNSRGEEQAVQECDDVMADVSLYGDTMAALSGKQVYSYSVNAVRNFRGGEGERQSAFHVTEAAGDTTAIVLSDESAVYMLGISEVRFEDY